MRGNLFAVAVDLVILTVRDGALHVLLVRRAGPPHAGALALPGGFVRPQEDLVDAAARELQEETGVAGHHLEQLASYAHPARDPRGRVLTVGHLAFVPNAPLPNAPDAPLPTATDTGGTDGTATATAWHPVSDVDELAFDHARILADGVERARAKLEYTTLAASFCPPEFTVAQLRGIYEAVWGAEIDPRNFQRKVTSTPGFLVPTARTVSGGRGRPAQLFHRGPATALHPPMLRGEP